MEDLSAWSKTVRNSVEVVVKDPPAATDKQLCRSRASALKLAMFYEFVAIPVIVRWLITVRLRAAPMNVSAGEKCHSRFLADPGVVV